MIIQGISFYLFAAVTIASGFLVITARNPVHSVLFLILAFFSSAGLFILMGAEFLAMILVVVYVGAVAVLFMFVVMMLDIDFVELREGFLQYLPLGVVIGIILLVELLVILGAGAFSPDAAVAGAEPIPPLDERSNIKAIGDVLYTKYIYLFQAAGMILLVAMIGAIVLTHRQRPNVRKQRIAEQLARRREDSVELKDVRPGQGV
jgi:NADH-quinone oxidoreductase subunit J